MVTKPSSDFRDHMPYICRNCLTEYWNGYSNEFCSQGCANNYQDELADAMTDMEIERKRMEDNP